MCELLGLCFAKPVAAAISISDFSLRAAENADGWGLAWYSGHSLSVVKEPLSWRKSRYASFLETYDGLLSHLFIGHVRHATVGGELSHANTHPFSRELDGRTYCFAHNGTVRDAFNTLPLGRFRPIGGTDSEHVFCHLLDVMATKHIRLATQVQWQWFADMCAGFNAMGKFNCLLSDGDRLFAWHDVNGFKGLHLHAVRVGGDKIEHLEDPAIEIELESETDNRGVVVATCPLGQDASWSKFRPGELMVFERGRVVYSSPGAAVTASANVAEQQTANAASNVSQ